MRSRSAAIAAVSMLIMWHPAAGQLPAFPGAEGVAQYITGGRGGDVYKVINLNDSGEGSLRFGIQTAPASGRTIVFDVAGTINLTSSLDFNGKDNITIAGQTAPAGGVTLSGHQLRVNSQKNNSTVVNQLDNVIIQFLRVRPTNANSNTDGVWVETGTNVMIDHVTTSWSVDESISVTHDSNNVTVQWSTMSQGLLSHSYGSLINGGNYTFHHNLYVHNKSRNPRIQDSGNRYLNLDFVNNVIYNPQDQFGYSDSNDPFDVNMVGNYGIKGPESNDITNNLMRPEDLDSQFYVSGNYMDSVRDGILNGVPQDGHDVFRQDGDYTLVDSRFGANLPEINTHTAQQAYIQVLSRAGAVNYRDPHDRDMIHSTMNQGIGHISSHTQWGAMPTLPTGTALPDANGDGVPDSWAATQGFDASEPLHQTYAPDGYTYLEKYLHSLTPFAYAPMNTVPHTIRTSFGNGADAQINENGGASAVSSGNGTAGAIDVHWAGASGSTNQTMLLRFDLSEIVPGSVDSARLDLTAASNIAGTQQFKVYGLIHDAEGWDWDEDTVEFADAPGLVFNGNSGSLGIDPRYTANGNPAARNNLPLPAPDDVLTLGTFSMGSLSEGDTVSFDNLNLAVLLNLAAYFEGEDQQGLVTIILQQINNSTAASFYSKEGSLEFAPRLVVDALFAVVDPPLLAGDFNNDGIVDAADYTVWRNHFGDATDDAINNAGDATGGIDLADYAVWKQHYGTSSSPMGSGGLADLTVPEPTSGLLLVIAALSVGTFCRRIAR